MNLICHAPEFPKLDHEFQQEAVWVVINKPGNKTSAKWDSKEPKQGFLAIASSTPRRNNQMRTYEQRSVVFTLVLLKDQYEQHAHYWQNQEYTLEIHWLHGLIPAARDYQACINSKRISLESQIIRGNLPAWPVNTAENALVNASPYIDQSGALDSLARVDSGIYCLQGPPGTGKTTTIVNVEKQWITRYPNDRILVCAPSNPAVQIVFERTLAQLPDVCIAVLINTRAPTNTTSDAYVNHFAFNLYHPLDDLLADKDISATEFQAKLLLEYERILQKLHELNQHRRKTFVKASIRSKIEQLEIYFSEKIRALRHEGASFELANLQESIDHLKNNAHFLEYFLVQRAQIVFATLTGSGRDFLKKQILHFERMIIDEATQATIPTTLIPLVSYDPNICLLVGDHKQLPAIIISRSAQNRDYDTSLFSAFVEHMQDGPYKMLSIQYRMHQYISLFASNLYYANALETDETVFGRSPLFPPQKKSIFRFPALFFDIKGKEIRQGHSFINEEEAEAIVATTMYLLQCGIQSGQIGIITFYAAQANKILEYIKKKLKMVPAGLTVSTADSFQGDERDIVLVSAVRTNKHDIGFLADSHRINVTMTRAKFNLGLFANLNAINQSHSDLATYSKHATIVPERGLVSEINSLAKPHAI